MMSKQPDQIAQVDSFSQLPFTRPTAQAQAQAQTQSPTSANSAPIRLFGFDFPPETDPNDHTSKSKSSAGEATTAPIVAPASAGASAGAISINRKFECHYCCRKFPTSQALGGHQNAHKRERQNAKRAHMAAAAVHGGHPYPNYVPDGYGLLNYHRLGLGLGAPPPPPSHYPSWSSSRFYGASPGSISQPIITGSPVPGVWRLPSYDPVQREKRMEMAPPGLFKGTELKGINVNVKDVKVGSDFGSSSSSTCSSTSPKERGRVLSVDGVKDGLSLDLHL